MLGLTSTAVDRVRDVCAYGGGCARKGVFTIEPLDEKENAESDEDNADDIFHGIVGDASTTDPNVAPSFPIGSELANPRTYFPDSRYTPDSFATPWQSYGLCPQAP